MDFINGDIKHRMNAKHSTMAWVCANSGSFVELKRAHTHDFLRSERRRPRALSVLVSFDTNLMHAKSNWISFVDDIHVLCLCSTVNFFLIIKSPLPLSCHAWNTIAWSKMVLMRLLVTMSKNNLTHFSLRWIFHFDSWESHARSIHSVRFSLSLKLSVWADAFYRLHFIRYNDVHHTVSKHLRSFDDKTRVNEDFSFLFFCNERLKKKTQSCFCWWLFWHRTDAEEKSVTDRTI